MPKAVKIVLAVATVTGVLALYRYTPEIVACWSGTVDIGKRGQFGDQFGAFNALVSTLAMLALIYTIVQQRSELNRAEGRWAQERSDLSRQHRADMMMRMVDRLVHFRASLKEWPSFTGKSFMNVTDLATSVEYINTHYMDEAGKDGVAVEIIDREFLARVYLALFEKYARAEVHAYISLLRAASRLVRSAADSERAEYCYLIASTMGHDEAFLAAYHGLLDPDIAVITSSIYKLNAMPTFKTMDPSHESILRSVA